VENPGGIGTIDSDIVDHMLHRYCVLIIGLYKLLHLFYIKGLTLTGIVIPGSGTDFRCRESAGFSTQFSQEFQQNTLGNQVISSFSTALLPKEGFKKTLHSFRRRVAVDNRRSPCCGTAKNFPGPFSGEPDPGKGPGICGIRYVVQGLFREVAEEFPRRKLRNFFSRQYRSAALLLGASEALDPTAEDVGRRLKLLTRGRGVDAAVEVSGSSQALQEALRGIAFGGTVVCGAFPPPYPAGLDLGAEAHMNCPQILFSRATSDPNREQPRWDAMRIEEECLHLIEQGHVQGFSIIDRIVPFADLREEYKLTMKNPSRTVKLGVVFPVAGSEHGGG
jgi:hypothetical protein